MLTRRRTKNNLCVKPHTPSPNANESFESCGSCDEPECGEPDCDLRRAIKELRNRKAKKKKKSKKLDDVFLSIIYLFLYILAFILFIENTVGNGVRYYDKDTTYLPLDLTCQHVYLEAVQRTRKIIKDKKEQKGSKKKQNNFKKMKKRIKYKLLTSFARGIILFIIDRFIKYIFILCIFTLKWKTCKHTCVPRLGNCSRVKVN